MDTRIQEWGIQVFKYSGMQEYDDEKLTNFDL